MTSSEAGVSEFLGDAADDILQYFFNTGFGCGADVKFRVVKFGVAWEIISIINAFVSVEALTQDLKSGVALPNNSESQFILLFLEHCNRHDDRSFHRPTCFEPCAQNSNVSEEKFEISSNQTKNV